MQQDLLSIVETSYDLSGDDVSWLNRVVAAARPMFDTGMGIAATLMDSTDAAPGETRLLAAASAGISDAAMQAIGALVQVGSTEEMRACFQKAGPVGTVRSTLGRAFRGEFRAVYESSGVTETLYVMAGDPRGVSCFLICPRQEPLTLQRSQKASYAYLAAHLATAHRLRQRAPTTSPECPDAEAVINQSGTVVHATGDAKEGDARAQLRDAVLAMMWARGPLRRHDAAGALEDWGALVAGRWSLVDHFDTDGRRFLVARRNEPHAQSIGGLSEHEAWVARLAAFGHPNKVIAYELGLSPRTVAAYLATAMATLGARSRLDLIRILTPVRDS